MALALAASTGVAVAADAEAGAVQFRKCTPCHNIGPGAKNKVGPELNGLEGRHSGIVEGFNYSDANKNSGITWNKETFLEYITDPRKKIPGTKMVFAGIKNEQDRENLWAYLSSFKADGSKK
ncbi:Cytochrome c2 [Rhodovulum sp. PH10]|uniref:c-type cytochrome n=1 Tax=Rhodovulum sp. PH10 TaxID=1187851 RepID=UPI00027C2759|nr:cytochrome c family protein [Rhodovulum sp. PH10]EJW13019.1 Cytochrome c2 [Rhodovulum sp. PH10]